ncbi:hypothetical protein TNCV_3558291 [Trichonephila clavipes]|uniref:Uncharacterized protein n=1 Tax=Trichonephila clavipes TaxID=2585209 RepID=A0A8X6WDZ3_TRICX|nr:hypothetical protein TNCV_3558291 [Trichonephila clavipes]
MTGSHNDQRRAGTPLTIGEACLKRILSPRLVSREWVYRTKVMRWTSLSRCWTRIMALFVSRRPASVFVCSARIGLGRPRADFCDWPMRRDEGRGVYPP